MSGPSGAPTHVRRYAMLTKRSRLSGLIITLFGRLRLYVDLNHAPNLHQDRVRLSKRSHFTLRNKDIGNTCASTNQLT